MCDCIENLEKKLTEKCKKENFRKPFKKVEIERALILKDNGLEARTYCRALIELEGQKKKIDTNIMHSYCPWCGEKINDEKAA